METLEFRENMETKKSYVGLSRSDSRVQSCSRVGQQRIRGDGSLLFRVQAQKRISNPLHFTGNTHVGKFLNTLRDMGINF